MNAQPSPHSGAALPRFVHDLLASPPAAGTGVHRWLFQVARVMHGFRSPAEIEAILLATTHGCGRSVPISEVRDAITNSRKAAWMPSAAGPGIPRDANLRRWPVVDPDLRAGVVAQGFGLADLWECSPIRPDETGPDAEQVIDWLFPHDALLCVGSDTRCARTERRQSLRGQLGSLQYIVPSAMTARTGKTKNGRTSARCLENTGTRRYLIVEFDSGAVDEHAALIGHLSDRAPLVMVVFSGRRSLHGWFRAFGHPESAIREFFAYALRLGADPATWTPCQFVRLPGGVRDSGVAQSIWFFNPGTLE